VQAFGESADRYPPGTRPVGLEDATDPGRIVDQFVVASGTSHLRRREPARQEPPTDRPGQPPVVTHWLIPGARNASMNSVGRLRLLLVRPPVGDVQAHAEDQGEGAARAEPGRHGGEAGQPARYADGDGR